MQYTRFLTLATLLMSFQACKKSEPIAEPPRTIRILAIENLTQDKSADYGGVISQSFVALRSGRIQSIRLLIEGRESPRDLLVLVRNVDENGYPVGELLATSLGTVIPSDPRKAEWYEFQLTDGIEATMGDRFCFELMPSKPHHGYGYFEYAYSIGDTYPDGRLHTDGHSRRVPEDRGHDLCFAVVFEVPEADAGDSPSALTHAKPGIIEIPELELPAETAGQETETPDPELSKLLGFLRMHHLDFDNRVGLRVQIWSKGGKRGSDLVVDEVISSPQFDIYYGHSSQDHPVFHQIKEGHGGSSMYLPDMGRTHYYQPVDLDAALEESILIGKDYSGPAKIWLRLTAPEPAR